MKCSNSEKWVQKNKIRNNGIQSKACSTNPTMSYSRENVTGQTCATVFQRFENSFSFIKKKSTLDEMDWRSCAEAIGSLAKYVFKKRDGFDWMPIEKLESLYSLIQQLVEKVESLKQLLGLTPRPHRSQTFRTDQASLMVKTVALVLSRSAGDLLRNESSQPSSPRPSLQEDVAPKRTAASMARVVGECLLLAGQIRSVVDAAEGCGPRRTDLSTP